MITRKSGMEWLAVNDPTYVKPAVKAVATRKVAFSPAAIEAMSGSAVRKVGGRYCQVSPIAFVGGSEESVGAIEPTYEATQEQEVLARQFSKPTHQPGKNSRANKNQRQRLAKRAK